MVCVVGTFSVKELEWQQSYSLHFESVYFSECMFTLSQCIHAKHSKCTSSYEYPTYVGVFYGFFMLIIAQSTVSAPNLLVIGTTFI